ncbi:cytochrome c oxidase assembly factor 4 homolog, mitochondrial [Latimeria chalumnae]|uniref:cytochrome c oxidase assembly factor 4 homolog, mitochondrial n=1 Tax=Latimeria chalumnae TaxID=7897 RepID=UPI0003C10810|nr:PREDICTED: cytochrome c oxidase assembly factor 4 homolog, mitochondrial [Latimeria chalumnae]XP_006007129.1 PREDICTED: cytochrome c oxidase assembly factor 4 homolog, mitochondrial [Latimeria chalumnae]|eukprot:XP_006007128.1 PREDICTED: cytochrome c oxidase assembly factor 4 homolog, mitochondrial [Latimeria chalumnae]
MTYQGPRPHNWGRKAKEEEEEEDPLDQMISRTGCAAFHYAVQECMAQQQDWRRCQEQVQAFKTCMMGQQKQRLDELHRQKLQHSPAPQN